MFFVYILRLCCEMFYVGSTKNLRSRLRAHNHGTGAEFTKLHAVQAVQVILPYESKKEALCGEMMATLWVMKKRGIDNVRGGPYSKINLSDTTKEGIQTLIQTLIDFSYDKLMATLQLMYERGQMNLSETQKVFDHLKVAVGLSLGA